MPTLTTEVPTVTRKELTELRDAENTLSEASRALSAAEAKVKPLRMALAEKALGTRTEAEYRALGPEEVAALIEKRLKKGLFELVRGAPGFSFEKTASGRYAAWKEEFVKAMGQAAADRITAETPTTYSYRVKVQ
jgi:hypothetical protein